MYHNIVHVSRQKSSSIMFVDNNIPSFKNLPRNIVFFASKLH